MRYILLFLFFVSQAAMARPISYPDGWTIMQHNNWEESRLHVHYTPDRKNSLGVVIENENDSDRYDVKGQWNHLLYRNNQKQSQANVYLKTQAGIAFEGDEKEPVASAHLAGDWETRRYFVSYEAHVEKAGNLDDGSFHQHGRIGIAPYVAEYGNIHTWLMLQAEHHPEEKGDEQLIVTPMVRVFKGDYLGEVGINSNGDGMFNWVVRF